ncbi:MAG: DUF4435 domain-containing protein [Barnesiella sp.]|nr:DUF4435 domain-containing protein [Barnesiella sp.]
MASTLISNVNSKAQLQANILTNTPNKVKVMVEDELDVAIWRKILTRFAPGYIFEIHPYSYDPNVHGKGKGQVLAMSHQFGKHFIGCIDSDNDWLLQQWATDDRINNSPYILQTHAYSIENLATQPYGIAECMTECCLHSCNLTHSLDEDYEQFLTTISEAVYDVLTWHLTMATEPGETYQDVIHKGRDRVFGNGHYNDIINSHNISLIEKRSAVTKRFIQRCAQLVNEYKSIYHTLEPKCTALALQLTEQYNLTHLNAYLFVRGHHLYDFLLHTFFNPLYLHLKKEHENEIRTHLYNGTEISDAIRHYHKRIKDFDNTFIFQHQYLTDASNPITMRLKDRINSIFM